jgi:hypothetical protein
MQVFGRYSSGLSAQQEQPPAPPETGSQTADQEHPPAPPQAGSQTADQEPADRKRWLGAVLIVVAVACACALFAVLDRISYNFPADSDSANNALQAWNMLHGNLLLHGWIIGDATYYTFELPLFMITEAIFGLGSADTHVVAAVVYTLVILSAAGLARSGSRGLTAAVRTGIVLVVMSIPLVLWHEIGVLLEKPDHTGTTAITILCFLLIDRWVARWFIAPVVGVILILGQLGDATVLYVTVPAIALVSLFRLIQARSLRTGDAAMLLAAGASVPLEMLLRKAMLNDGGFLMVAPRTQLAPSSMLAANWHFTQQALQQLFGALTGPLSALGAVGAAFGWAAIAAAAYGFGRVIVTWLRASRGEQLLCIAILVNVAAYMFSTLPMDNNPREVVLVLPAGAVLAARGLGRPGLLAGRRAWAVLAGVACLAVVPLAAAATQPTQTPTQVPLAAWLKAHNLRYGIAGYWNSGNVTLASRDGVMVRAVSKRYFGFSADDWETNWTWYYPSHEATFAIADPPPLPGAAEIRTQITVKDFEKVFGKPVARYPVAGHIVLVYRQNLLLNVAPALPIPANTGPHHFLPREHRHHHGRR